MKSRKNKIGILLILGVIILLLIQYFGVLDIMKESQGEHTREIRMEMKGVFFE